MQLLHTTPAGPTESARLGPERRRTTPGAAVVHKQAHLLDLHQRCQATKTVRAVLALHNQAQHGNPRCGSSLLGDEMSAQSLRWVADYRIQSTFSDPQKGRGQSLLRRCPRKTCLYRGTSLPYNRMVVCCTGRSIFDHWQHMQHFILDFHPQTTCQKRHRLERNHELFGNPPPIDTRH